MTFGARCALALLSLSALPRPGAAQPTEAPAQTPVTTTDNIGNRRGRNVIPIPGCTIIGSYYTPYPMEGSAQTSENGWDWCQMRCNHTLFCEHFSYWPDGGCLLQGINVTLQRAVCNGTDTTCAGTRVVSGPKDCALRSSWANPPSPEAEPVVLASTTAAVTTTLASTTTEASSTPVAVIAPVELPPVPTVPTEASSTPVAVIAPVELPPVPTVPPPPLPEPPAGALVIGWMYVPQTMPVGGTRTVEADWRACMARCADTLNCAYWGFWPDGGCHLQDANATLEAGHCLEPGETTCDGSQVVTGPRVFGDPSTYPQHPAASTPSAAPASLPGDVVIVDAPTVPSGSNRDVDVVGGGGMVNVDGGAGASNRDVEVTEAQGGEEAARGDFHTWGIWLLIVGLAGLAAGGVAYYLGFMDDLPCCGKDEEEDADGDVDTMEEGQTEEAELGEALVVHAR